MLQLLPQAHFFLFLRHRQDLDLRDGMFLMMDLYPLELSEAVNAQIGARIFSKDTRTFISERKREPRHQKQKQNGHQTSHTSEQNHRI